MAKSVSKVLLGFEDELISDKYKTQVNFSTNKIGGKPNWPGESPVTSVTCKLCGLDVPLVLQIYAPLENSPFHRTLYIFACINTNCWNQNGSWICLRVQCPENQNEGKNNGASVMENTDWCAGGDCWDDEENGNTIVEVLSNRRPGQVTGEFDLRQEMAGLSVDDNNANANRGGPAEGAMGVVVPTPTAVIEADEGDVVHIDTPTTPQVNLVAMLEEATTLPLVSASELEFVSFFVSVGEEDLSSSQSWAGSDRLREMMREYQMNCVEDEGCSYTEKDVESYEKGIPAHGDKLFHQMITRIHCNPGQILRYGGPPLLLYPLQDKLRTCPYCRGDLKFELQILPTLIPKLRLTQTAGAESVGSHLEFGSVYLYSCRASCWQPGETGVREELLIVQMEKI